MPQDFINVQNVVHLETKGKPPNIGDRKKKRKKQFLFNIRCHKPFGPHPKHPIFWGTPSFLSTLGGTLRGTFSESPKIGGKRSTQTFFVESFSRTLRLMDVRAENRGRPHQKVCVFCGPGDGEKLFDPRASGRKGQECPREIRTEKFMFMLFFLP